MWLLTAGGAMFAAFPLWYASLFSGFYLALLIILITLTLFTLHGATLLSSKTAGEVRQRARTASPRSRSRPPW